MLYGFDSNNANGEYHSIVVTGTVVTVVSCEGKGVSEEASVIVVLTGVVLETASLGTAVVMAEDSAVEVWVSSGFVSETVSEEEISSVCS